MAGLWSKIGLGNRLVQTNHPARTDNGIQPITLAKEPPMATSTPVRKSIGNPAVAFIAPWASAGARTRPRTRGSRPYVT